MPFHKPFPAALAALAVLSLLATLVPAAWCETLTLFDFTRPSSAGRWEASGLSVAREHGRLVLSTAASRGGTLRMLPPDDAWDVSAYTRLQVEVSNPGKTTVHYRVRAENDGASDWGNSAINDGFLHPGRRKLFNVILYRSGRARDQHPELKRFAGMNGVPGGLVGHWHTIDAANVRRLLLEVFPADTPQRLEVFRVVASYPVVPEELKVGAEGFFPFVDRFGQYRHAKWPGKVSSESDLKAIARRESKDLARHPGPSAWNRFGGWAGGPRREATGWFRAEKFAGKWWLVDPDGRLFWSHGANSVGYDSAGSPITGREDFFESLPPKDGAFTAAWSRSGDREYVDFLRANLVRQHGPGWESTVRDLAHRRLRSWGMNTVANWSNGDIYRMERTPYTVAVHPWAPEVFPGMWDVFRPEFAERFDEGIREGVKDTKDDPWCIGYFVDNERAWSGSPTDFVAGVLAADPAAASKRALIEALREAHPDVSDFNARTGQSFADWDAVTANRERIRLDGVKATADAFYECFCERYFRVVAEAVHKWAPHHLYLGCRMHVSNPILVSAAARHCDVLSFNRYQPDVRGFRPYEVDKPVLISEFHFGALDRGNLSTGLQPASDQQDRADRYRFYVESALRNPYVVGTHWFAFCPQALTGRGDGENHEDGLFNIVNDPYPELRQALRDVGYRLYESRLERKETPSWRVSRRPSR